MHGSSYSTHNWTVFPGILLKHKTKCRGGQSEVGIHEVKSNKQVWIYNSQRIWKEKKSSNMYLVM